MTITDQGRVGRDYAVVDLMRSLPDVVTYAALREISEESREDLYLFLKQVENERAEPQFDTWAETRGLR